MTTQTLPELNASVDEFKVTERVYYRQQYREVENSLRAYACDVPVIFKGPTGSGKTTLMLHLCYLLGTGFDELRTLYGKKLQKKVPHKDNQEKTVLELLEYKTHGFRGGFPLITAGGQEDLDATQLKGSPFPVGDKTYWLNGPARLATKYGGIFYFDEPTEARPDTRVAIHSLSDDRRTLLIEALGSTQNAHLSFGFFQSYNDQYQDPRKRFKPSTSQRFAHFRIGYPDEAVELEIVKTKTNLEESTIKHLLSIAANTRNMAANRKLKEGASPRAVIKAATLIGAGMNEYEAVMSCLAEPLTDDLEILKGLEETVTKIFRKI